MGEMAIKASKAMGGGILGIDMMEDENQKSISSGAFFLQILRGIIDSYPILFGKGNGEAEKDDSASKWGWLITIDNLAKGYENWNYYFDMNIVEFLNLVCFHIDKTEKKDA